jgi:hypothetical protein
MLLAPAPKSHRSYAFSSETELDVIVSLLLSCWVRRSAARGVTTPPRRAKTSSQAVAQLFVWVRNPYVFIAAPSSTYHYTIINVMRFPQAVRDGPIRVLPRGAVG